MSATDERRLALTPPPAPTTEAAPADPPPSGVRASDTEREATVARLHQALGEGCLDLDETDERVTAAYAARHRDELHSLLADLPNSRVHGAEAPTWGEVWTSVVWRARATLLGSSEAPPTAEQRRTAVVLTALVGLWLVACAFLGAVLTN